VKRPELGLAALVLIGCAWFYQAGGWNQNVRFDLTRAIVEDGSSRIDRLAKNTGDLAIKDGAIYCDKAPGASWLAVPAYAVAHAVAGSAKPTPRYLAWSAWLCTLFAVGIPSAIAAVAMALLLQAWGHRPRSACGWAAAWSLATLAWPYGTLLYGHQLVASLLVIGLAMIVAPGRGASEAGSVPPGPTSDVGHGDQPSRARLVGAGAVLGFAVVVEYPAALACLVIGGYAIARLGWRRALWIAAGAVPPAIALALYHWMVFGGPTTLPYEFSNQKNRSQGFFMGIGVPDPDALWGITFSAYRGLFWSTPWLLLAIPGAVFHWRAGRRAEVALCAAIFVLFVWLNASLVDWQGGWAMGARYLIPSIPFLVLLAAAIPRPHPVVPLLVIALVAHGGVHMLIGTAVKPEVPTPIKQPYQEFLYPRFSRGELAASTQGIHQKGAAKKGRQAWNLGEQLGLGGLATLVPMAILMLGAAGWITWSTRRAGRDTHDPDGP
jgi:hypothetical protein